ncbi:hypothetical protein [Anatilimnocola floriformis]|uniref:hypothetical protein n=1 Tax=Anatilimnocola floriformis TaxID=2948575 RepID=UPI0020C45503|nr:hypothetical protein [Anatilimnocola floriformis]
MAESERIARLEATVVALSEQLLVVAQQVGTLTEHLRDLTKHVRDHVIDGPHDQGRDEADWWKQ